MQIFVFLEKKAKRDEVGMIEVRKISEKAKRGRNKSLALIFHSMKRKQTVKSAGRISRYSTHRTKNDKGYIKRIVTRLSKRNGGDCSSDGQRKLYCWRENLP